MASRDLVPACGKGSGTGVDTRGYRQLSNRWPDQPIARPSYADNGAL